MNQQCSRNPRTGWSIARGGKFAAPTQPLWMPTFEKLASEARSIIVVAKEENQRLTDEKRFGHPGGCGTTLVRKIKWCPPASKRMTPRLAFAGVSSMSIDSTTAELLGSRRHWIEV